MQGNGTQRAGKGAYSRFLVVPVCTSTSSQPRPRSLESLHHNRWVFYLGEYHAMLLRWVRFFVPLHVVCAGLVLDVLDVLMVDKTKADRFAAGSRGG
jgi:hypothetical protein